MLICGRVMLEDERKYLYRGLGINRLNASRYGGFYGFPGKDGVWYG